MDDTNGIRSTWTIREMAMVTKCSPCRRVALFVRARSVPAASARVVLMALVVGLAGGTALGQDREGPNREAPARDVSGEGSTDRAEQVPTDADSIDQRAGHAADTKLEDILSGLDPAIFSSLIGAEVQFETVGDQLILQGPEEAVSAIELLITLLDKGAERKVLEIVRVYKRDANEIARSIEQPLRDVLGEANQRAIDDLSVTALSAGVLMVSALPKDIDFVIGVIEQVDEAEELPEFEQLVFPIKFLKASDVAAQLEDILRGINARVGKTGAEAEIQIVANSANNSVLVIAPEEQRLKIQKLINELDVEPVAGWSDLKLTLYPLLHSDAAELAQVITDLLATSKDREAAEEAILRLSISKALPNGELIELPAIDLQKPSRIIPDAGTRSLIIATASDNVKPMGELVRLLDAVAIAEEIGVKIFPLTFADAQSVADSINNMFDKGKNLPADPDGSGVEAVATGATGEAVAYNVAVSVDVRTNTILVAGRQEQLSLAEMIVGELDRPMTSLKFPLRMLELEYTDATRIGKLVTELFDKRITALEATGTTGAALERERVFLTVDIRSNSLILSSSEENYAEIVEITRQLDTIPAKLFDQIRIVPCERLSVDDLKKKIDDLWERKASLRREGEMLEDLPVVVADGRSNSLIIASSVEDFTEIESLVKTLEGLPLIDDIRLFALRFADAAVLSGTLDELFQGLASQSEAFEAPTILADPRSNALVVAGPRDSMERVADVVQRLDVEAGPLTAIFKVYPLQHGSAVRLAPRMQELFDSRREGGDASGTPIVIFAEESSNSLVCSASRDDHVTIIDLLELLDKPSNLAKQVRIFPLRLAKAPTVADKLESLFPAQGDSGSGRADVIAAEADERTNSIIVWASPTEMANIAQVIERLDTAAPAVEMMLKVIQLKQALANDFAQLLDDVLIGDEGGGGDDQRAIIVSFLEKTVDGKETLRKLLRQDIRIQADPRTNSLMVMAPAGSMEMLEAMIKDFDKIRPITSEIRLFPLVNSDAETMVDQLTGLFEQSSGTDGETRSQLVFGDVVNADDLATIGQELRFAADPRTNTLLVAGSNVYVTMIEDLVRYLDSQEAEDRVVEVYHAKYRDGNELATAVQGFIDQELAVLGEGDDQESLMRRMERQVSVEAIGDTQQGSSSLVVGTSRRSYQRTMDMIQALDRPEPQVRISVLIAEVTLNDDIELGVEIAGQDLLFTEKAFVPLAANGVIKGANFDFVGGSNLNAQGNGLGFNFTITGEDFGFLLHAVQSNSRLEVLSRPTLLVRNGEEGTLTIADQIPIVQQSNVTDSGQVQSTIGREDVGIVLTVTPHISPDGYVTIDLSQEISNVSGENVQLTEGVSNPVFQTREVQTNVTVRDGETVVIGGLIQDQVSTGETKVPILGDIPYLGALFRTTGDTHRRTELLVVLTVDVLNNDADLREMSAFERDVLHFEPGLLQSPLMEGMRIVPSQSGLGPTSRKDETSDRPSSDPRPATPKRYGPKPSQYGPPSPRTVPASDTKRVYGPSPDSSWVATAE